MAPKTKRPRRARTSDRPPASDPNPTTISPSTSVATSEIPPPPPFFHPPPSLPPHQPPPPPTSLSCRCPFRFHPQPQQSPPPNLPPRPRPRPYPSKKSIQETHQERVSGTSLGTTTTTTTDSAGPSTAPSASAASRKLPAVILPTTEEFLFRFLPKFITRILATEELREMVPDVTDSPPRPMDSDLRTLLEVAEKEMMAASDFLSDMEALMGGLGGALTLLEEEEMNWDY